MTTELYPTKELSRLTGVPESTIRAWKSRGKLSPDLFVDAEGSTLWKAEAITAIQAIQSGSSATVSNTLPATQCDAATNLDAVESMIAELLADDALPEIESKVSCDRIQGKALKIVAARIAQKLKSERLEQWQLVTDNLNFSPCGVVGSLPASEVKS